MGNKNATLAEFANNLWNNFIKKKLHDSEKDVLHYYRATVVSNPGYGKLVVKKPYDEQITISCTDHMDAAEEGDQVIVIRFGNGNANLNHLAVAFASGRLSR